MVYADATGAPGALLATTGELAYRSSDAAGWYFLDFARRQTQANPSGLLQLTPGAYWIGVIAGDESGVAGVAYDSIPATDEQNTNPYPAGPSDPFGPGTAGDERLSLYMDYFAPPF